MTMRGGNFMYYRRVMASKCGNHVRFRHWMVLILILPTIASYIPENALFFVAEFQQTCMSPTLSPFCHLIVFDYYLSTIADVECAFCESRIDTKIE